MKMNSKGFTLVELLVTIGLLGIISAVAISSYSSFYDAIQEKNINNNIELIKESAINYYNNTLETTFLVNDLLEKGYLKANENNSYYIDKEDYRCYSIHISVINKKVNDKIYEKITAKIGEKYIDSLNECDYSNLKNNEIELSYNEEASKILVNIPAKSKLTLISNLGHYNIKENNTDNYMEYEYQLDLFNLPTNYKGNIIITATIVTSKKIDNIDVQTVGTKSIAITKGE